MLSNLNPVLIYGAVGFSLLLCVLILKKWQLGVYFLLLLLPFIGLIVTKTRSQAPLLALDVLFIFPVYFSFFIIRKGEKVFYDLPKSFVLLMFLFCSLVIVQCFNPHSYNFLVAVIGVKIWLLYLPLVFVGARIAKSVKELKQILLILVIPSIIPCLLGIYQWFSCHYFGYQETMARFYGDQAEAMTQGFESFEFGTRIYRIPSTFRYVVQYSNYTLGIIACSFSLCFLKQGSVIQKNLFRVCFFIATMASFLSGARAMFVFVPMLLLLTYWHYKNITGVIRAVFVVSFLAFVALFVSDLDISKIYDTISFLLFHYGDEIVKEGFVYAIWEYPFGKGTGMNTGPARHVVPDGYAFSAFENFYAKAIIELGILGFVLLFFLFLFILISCYRVHFRLKSRHIRATSSALLAYIIVMMINSFKGWPLDLTPSNIYFWLFIGIHLSLLKIENSMQEQSFTLDLNEGIKEESDKL